jgi:hypothetical protein
MENPFIAGPIIDPQWFIGRRYEISYLLSAIQNRLSVCVIGEPHIGKTSLLKYVANPSLTDSTGPEHVFIYRDGMSLRDQNTPAKFWQSVLREVVTRIKKKEVKRRISELIGNINRSADCVRLAMEVLIENNLVMVLIIDELDVMVSEPRLADISFWGQFRYLASARLFCFLSASRHDLFTVNTILNRALTDHMPQYRNLGSPIFNIADSIYLRPFIDVEVSRFFEKTSASSSFTPLDINIIRKLSGGHPYLLQKAGSHLWRFKSQNETVDYQRYIETLLENTDDYMQDVWMQLETKPGSRALAVMITLRELGRNTHDITVLNKDINAFVQASQPLERIGMIQRTENNFELVGSLYAFWIQRNILARPIVDHEKYLADKEVRSMNMTNEQQKSMFQAMDRIYQEIKGVVSDVSTAFVKSQLGL